MKPKKTREIVPALSRLPTVQELARALSERQVLPAAQGERAQGRRGHALELQERMLAFSAIYNAAWHVRAAYYGPADRRRDAVMQLIAVLLQELRDTQDHEACAYAFADALYKSPLGVPWEP